VRETTRRRNDEQFDFSDPRAILPTIRERRRETDSSARFATAGARWSGPESVVLMSPGRAGEYETRAGAPSRRHVCLRASRRCDRTSAFAGYSYPAGPPFTRPIHKNSAPSMRRVGPSNKGEEIFDTRGESTPSASHHALPWLSGRRSDSLYYRHPLRPVRLFKRNPSAPFPRFPGLAHATVQARPDCCAPLQLRLARPKGEMPTMRIWKTVTLLDPDDRRSLLQRRPLRTRLAAEDSSTPAATSPQQKKLPLPPTTNLLLALARPPHLRQRPLPPLTKPRPQRPSQRRFLRGPR
jgi:hypothetical protein